jgi:hypothetical protein
VLRPRVREPSCPPWATVSPRVAARARPRQRSARTTASRLLPLASHSASQLSRPLRAPKAAPEHSCSRRLGPTPGRALLRPYHCRSARLLAPAWAAPHHASAGTCLRARPAPAASPAAPPLAHATLCRRALCPNPRRAAACSALLAHAPALAASRRSRPGRPLTARGRCCLCRRAPDPAPAPVLRKERRDRGKEAGREEMGGRVKKIRRPPG